MSRYGLERHNETLLRLGERWRTQLDQPTKADAAPDAECISPCQPHGLARTQRVVAPLNRPWRVEWTDPLCGGTFSAGRIVNTERDG